MELPSKKAWIEKNKKFHSFNVKVTISLFYLIPDFSLNSIHVAGIGFS